MDMLTRLMYGGRVSLYIGFIVVFIESIIGVVLGGISGYCGYSRETRRLKDVKSNV
jgi:peptide/nickel transport system permease protein